MKSRSGTLAVRLAATVLVVNAFVYAIAAVALAESRSRYLRDSEIARLNIARSLATNISAMMDRVDITLYNIALQVEQYGGKPMNETFLNAYLVAQKQLVRDVESLWVLDAQGMARWSSEDLRAPLNVAQRPYFQVALRETGGHTFVSQPAIGVRTGEWQLYFAHRIERPDGTLSGVAAASLSLKDYFYGLFSPIQLGKTALITVRHEDLTLYARHVNGAQDMSEIGSQAISDELAAEIRRNPQNGVVVGPSRLDGVERRFAYQKDSRHPFYVIVGQQTGEILGPWYREATIIGALLLIFTVTSVLYSRSSWRRVQQMTEAREAEARSVAASRERLQTIMDAAPVGIAMGVGGKVKLVNPKITEIFDVKVGGDLVSLYVDPAEREAVGEELRAGKSVTREMRMYDRDRQVRHMVVTYVPTSFDGEPATLGWMVDMTERKKAEEIVREAKDAALAATQAKSDFLANMSHEIRTPLNAVIGLAHILQRDNAAPGHERRLQQIERSGEHLLSLINDVLDLSKIEAGKFELETTTFTLGSLLADVESMLQPQAQAKGLRLQAEGIDSPLVLRGDVTRLRQALINYLSNAVKFTEKGSVDLRCKVLEESAGTVLLRFEVQDTGVGIPPDKLQKLFTPFQQVDSSTSRKYGGTGLGLAINQHLAQLMGGSIEVTSKEGEGSCFAFVVRLDRVESGVATRPVAGDAAIAALRERYAGSRVLLAEDNPLSAEVALDFLRHAGLVAARAANGREAIELARCGDFDLVLMDMQMPEVDGLEATRRIRALPGRASQPIVALTANVFAEDKQRCLAAGMDDVLSKPLRPAQLYAALLKWLPPRGRAAASPTHGPAAAGGPRQAALAGLELLARQPGFNRDRVMDFQTQPAKYPYMLGMLCDMGAQELQKIEAWLQAGDDAPARSAAHSLRGAAAMLGAESVQDSVGRLENALQGEVGQQAMELLKEVRASFAQLAQVLEEGSVAAQEE